jgi:hypothetical protein
VAWLALPWLAGPAAGQAADPERQTAAMIQTVLQQLEAFRRGDWAAAYGFASSSIRSRFTPEAFREMVTGGYAPIARPLQSRVLATRTLDPQRGLVEIRVEGQNGETVDALYELVEEQGAWRINGVVARPVPQGPLVFTLGGSDRRSSPRPPHRGGTFGSADPAACDRHRGGTWGSATPGAGDLRVRTA